MSDQDLINKGFHEYSPSAFDHESVETCFQKRYDDENGKKYFITVKKWKEFYHPHTHEVYPPNYEYDTQLYKKDGHDAVDVLFHSSWNIEDVEDYLEKLWGTGLFDYYEMWDGSRGSE